jgi:hypothetical protein
MSILEVRSEPVKDLLEIGVMSAPESKSAASAAGVTSLPGLFFGISPAVTVTFSKGLVRIV